MKNFIIIIFLLFIGKNNLCAQNIELNSYQMFEPIRKVYITNTVKDSIGNTYYVGRFTDSLKINNSNWYISTHKYNLFIASISQNKTINWLRILKSKNYITPANFILKNNLLINKFQNRDTTTIDSIIISYDKYATNHSPSFLLALDINTGQVNFTKHYVVVAGSRFELTTNNLNNLNVSMGSIYDLDSNYNFIDSIPKINNCEFTSNVIKDKYSINIGYNYNSTTPLYFDTCLLLTQQSEGYMEGKVLIIKRDNATKQPIWARGIVGKSFSSVGAGEIKDIKTLVDKNDNVFVFGYARECWLKFHTGPNIPTSGNAAFVAKYDSSGNLLWARVITLNGFGDGALDSLGNVYVALNNGFSVLSYIFGGITYSYKDIAIPIFKYDNNGTEMYPILTPGTAAFSTSHLTVHAPDSFTVAGGFFGDTLIIDTATFYGAKGNSTLEATGLVLSFKYTHYPLSIAPATANTSITLFPNPVTNLLQITEPIKAINITTIHGKTVLQSTTTATSINVSTLPPGIYFATITKQNNKTIIKKFIKQ